VSTPIPSKPVPTPDDASQPFFDGARRGDLMIRRCRACGAAMWAASHSGSLPVSPRCLTCFSTELDWEAASGSASLYSFVIVHQPYPGFQDDVPYNVALVDLDEGPRILSQVVDCANDDLAIGMPLEVTFERRSDDVFIPMFRRAT
jgi:uncharacterized OB-fold protein